MKIVRKALVEFEAISGDGVVPEPEAIGMVREMGKVVVLSIFRFFLRFFFKGGSTLFGEGLLLRRTISKTRTSDYASFQESSTHL